jgi:cell wall-associated NlpC family hydrolase
MRQSLLERKEQHGQLDLSWTDCYRQIPYVLGGASVAGVDCWGLCRLVARRECGLSLPDINAPTAGLRGQMAAFDLQKQGAPVVLEGAPIPLHSIVLMGPRPDSSIATHAGMHVGFGFVMHAGSAFGVRVDCIDQLNDLALHVVSIHDIYQAAAWLAGRS